MQIRPKAIFVLIVLAFLTFYSRLIFLLSPGLRTWGIDHLRFLSVHHTIIFTCCFIFLLLLLIPKFNSFFVRIFENLSNLFGGKVYSKWAVAALVSLPVFWFLRMPTNFLGDGYAIINNIGNDLPVMYKWTEMGAIAAADFINKLIPYSGLQSSAYASAILSVLSGGVAVFFFLGIAHELAETKIYRLFIFCILLFSGWTLLFFGYVENYPLLWASITGYLYFAIKYMNKKCGIIWPVLLLVISYAIHLQSLFFAISFPVLLISRYPIRNIYLQYKKALLSITAIFVLSGMAVFVYQYFQSLSIQAHFLPLLNGKPPADYYTLLSIPHFLDILNEYSLLIPIWPILLYLSIMSFKSAKRDSIWRFLVAFSLGGLILILILDPRLGMGRDWDLFAIVGLGPALLFLKTIDASKLKLKRYYPVLAMLSLLMVMPYFMVNLQYRPSIEYFNSLLDLDRDKSKSGMAALRDYYFRDGNENKADSINLKMGEHFPNLSLAPYCQRAIDSGKIVHALAVAEKILENEPFNPEGYTLRGKAYLKNKNYEKAIDDFNLALELEPYNPGHHLNFTLLYFQQRKIHKMLDHCRESFALNPNMRITHWYLGNGYYMTRQYDSALVYLEKVIVGYPKRLQNYKMAGYSAYHTRDLEKAKKYLSYYLTHVPNDPDKDAVAQMLGAAY